MFSRRATLVALALVGAGQAATAQVPPAKRQPSTPGSGPAPATASSGPAPATVSNWTGGQFGAFGGDSTLAQNFTEPGAHLCPGVGLGLPCPESWGQGDADAGSWRAHRVLLL